jgi:uncharacterized protein
MRTRATTGLAAVVALLATSVAAAAGDYAPLDCDKASLPAEKTICGSYELGQREARMATLYSIVTSLVAMGQRGDIQEAQRKWLATRDACGRNVGCLTAAYDDRIRSLNGAIGNIASRGPY